MARVWLHRYVPAAISAIAVPLALPNELAPLGNPLLGPFAFAPLFLSIYRCRSHAQAAAATVLFMVVATPLSYYWLLYFREYALWTLGGPVLGYALFGAMLGPVLRGVALAAGRLRPYAVAAAWTVYEFLKSSGFLGFPWGLAAYPVNTVIPLIQFTALTGVWGLSLLMALVNAAVAEGVQRNWRLQPVGTYLVIGLLAAGALGYGFARLATEGSREPGAGEGTRIEMALIQHNVDPWGGGIEEHADSLRTLMRLTRRVLDRSGPDLIVWSETALPDQPVGEYAELFSYKVDFERLPNGDPLGPFLRSLDTHLITGAPYVIDPAAFEYSNASFLIGPRATRFDHYRKQQLVPFGEAVPFYEVEFVRRFYRSAVGIGSGWVAGDHPTVFTVNLSNGRGVRLSTPICFEDAFPALNRRFVRAGAEVLVNLTNDSWSRTVSSETQHLVAARFRSVENARPLLRSTNGGITAALDVYGRTIPGSVLPPFTEDAALVTLHLPATTATTPYTAFGDYLPVALILVLILLLAPRHRRLRRRCRPIPTDR